jgi:hypothetical protein
MGPEKTEGSEMNGSESFTNSICPELLHKINYDFLLSLPYVCSVGSLKDLNKGPITSYIHVLYFSMK